MAAYTSNEERDTIAPTAFICPLTLEVMRDPVVSRYGQSYERSAILQWLVEGNTSCPMTRQNLRMADLISNQPLRLKIRRWQLENDLDVNIIMETPDDGGNRILAYFTLPVHLQGSDDEAERSLDDPDVIQESTHLPAGRFRRNTRNVASSSPRRTKRSSLLSRILSRRAVAA